PLFYLTLPVAEKRSSSGKEEEERKTKVQALVQLRQQAPMAELSGSVPLVNCPAERASTWDMLIRLSFRAEGTSNFFPIKEEPADTPTCTKVEAETQLGFSGVRSRRQPVPRPCLPDSSPEIDPRSSGPKEPPAEPQRRGESRAASPFSELQ
ncbi:hypothetical protein KUCAC02_010057, partial [Chaenocephalus aceratus]